MLSPNTTHKTTFVKVLSRPFTNINIHKKNPLDSSYSLILVDKIVLHMFALYNYETHNKIHLMKNIYTLKPSLKYWSEINMISP